MTELLSPFIGISRHRINSDGRGVTTLAAFHGCPLSCKYCLNPQSLRPGGVWRRLSPRQLLSEVSIDNIYFLATGGGVTFGGGEPLLRPDFLLEFKRICNPQWAITVETSLNVPLDSLKAADTAIDKYFVDIKDLDADTYKAYTGHCNDNVMRNLDYLRSMGRLGAVTIKVPYIEGFNTRDWVERECERLKSEGYPDIMRLDYLTEISK